MTKIKSSISSLTMKGNFHMGSYFLLLKVQLKIMNLKAVLVFYEHLFCLCSSIQFISRPFYISPPIINGATTQNQANMWADHYSHVFKEPNSDSDLPRRYASPILAPPEPISADELKNVVAQLQPGKAIGADGAGAWDFQNATGALLHNFRLIYSKIMASAHFPAPMLEHKISIIPK